MARSEYVVIRGGRIVDPSQNLDVVGDLIIERDRIVGVAPRGGAGTPDGASIIDATGLVISPGFVDVHTHLRQPGQEHKETIATGTRAAARGGFTTICSMANTTPVIDNRGLVEYVQRIARSEGVVRVLPLAAMTIGLAGKELVEMADLSDAGVVAFSDDGIPTRDSRVMRHAFEYARRFEKPLMPHCDDPDLMGDGAMHEGMVSARLGIPGMPGAGEEIMVGRDVALAGLTDGRLHVCHVSVAGAVRQIRMGKEQGIRVTGEATPHHLTMTDAWVSGERWDGAKGDPYDSNTKMNPPLRTEEDRQALVSALKDGTLDAIATDHAPHSSEDKHQEFGSAAFGIVGLETALATVMRLVHRGEIDLRLAIEKMTVGPARVFNLPYGTLRAGAAADVTVFDPNFVWRVDPSASASLGRNTPLAGLTVRGQVMVTMYGGQTVHVDEAARGRVDPGAMSPEP
ncbi:MAG TPA: dihydroorotase [Chloroflexota bacterium]|nr:dihydroorotase [Chloroflexota bacterium]